MLSLFRDDFSNAIAHGINKFGINSLRFLVSVFFINVFRIGSSDPIDQGVSLVFKYRSDFVLFDLRDWLFSCGRHDHHLRGHGGHLVLDTGLQDVEEEQKGQEGEGGHSGSPSTPSLIHASPAVVEAVTGK